MKNELIPVTVYKGEEKKVLSSMAEANEFCRKSGDSWLIDCEKYNNDIEANRQDFTHSIHTEIKLLEPLCGESVFDTLLYENKHNTEAQLIVIGRYCHQLGMSISDMVAIGKKHCFDESEYLLKNLTTFYLLSFEDIVRRMCENTIMTEEQIDNMVDGITLFHESCDTFYTLSMDGYFVDFGDNSLSWLPYNKYKESTNGNLKSNFSLFKLIDSGTEIEYTNDDDGEYGYINGIRHDLANLSDDEENSLLLSMLRIATRKMLVE
jgi:hypothetical protein